MKFSRKHLLKTLRHTLKNGQTAIEYLILLGVVTTVCLLMFKNRLPIFVHDSENFFNKAVEGLYGDVPNADPTWDNYP